MKIYYAHPKKSYGSIKEKMDIALIQKKYPGAEIINPGDGMFTLEEDWMRFMNHKFKDMNLVIFTTYHGFIGKGIHYEIMQARAHKIPIVFLTNQYKFEPNFELGPTNPDDWIYHSKVELKKI